MFQEPRFAESDMDLRRIELTRLIGDLITNRCVELNQADGKPTSAQYQALTICIASDLDRKRQLSADLGADGLYQLIIEQLANVEDGELRELVLTDLFEEFSHQLAAIKRQQITAKYRQAKAA